MSRQRAGVSVNSTRARKTRIMPADKECPLCGEMMRLEDKEAIVQIPGNPTPSTTHTREWTCPDCDYFEEAEEERR